MFMMKENWIDGGRGGDDNLFPLCPILKILDEV